MQVVILVVCIGQASGGGFGTCGATCTQWENIPFTLVGLPGCQVTSAVFEPYLCRHCCITPEMMSRIRNLVVSSVQESLRVVLASSCDWIVV